ncbi:MAG: hypothetical protein ACOY82_06815 [Pseudomonadota bacterium]
MSTVPRIETPCPLSAAEQRAVDGHCGHCDREVHRLDGLGDAARRELFAAATGPLCVSYRAPRRVGRIGAAIAGTIAGTIAATLVTTGAYAADPVEQRTAEPIAAESRPAAQTGRTAPTTGTRIQREAPDELDEVLIVGAVIDPQDARAPEDASVPALPTRDAQPRTGTRIQREAPNDLDEVLVVGAVIDPQDAAQPEDRSVPALPVRDALDAVAEDVAAIDEDDVLIMGGVSDPAAVEWVDTTGIADLPLVTDATVGKDGR